MDSEQQITERWSELVEAQVLRPDHLDDDGEIIYVIDEDNLKEYDPILYQQYKDDWDSQIAAIVSAGLMEVYLDDDGVPYFEPTQKAEDWLAAYEEEQVD